MPIIWSIDLKSGKERHGGKLDRPKFWSIRFFLHLYASTSLQQILRTPAYHKDLTNPSFGCLLPQEKSSEVRSAEIKQVPMPASTDRPLHAVLIPWVIALVALIGLNAVVPDYSRTRKNDSNGETGLSQPADAPPAPGHISSPLVFLIPHVTCRAAILVSHVVCLEVFRAERPAALPQGAVHGRAPPTGSIA
jgi:hypothetical protein